MQPARLMLSDAEDVVAEIGFATYKMAGASNADTRCEAIAERAGDLTVTKTLVTDVVGYLPARKAAVAVMPAKLVLVEHVASRVQSMISSGERTGLRSMLELRFDPALDVAALQLNLVITRVDEVVRAVTGSVRMQSEAAQKIVKNAEAAASRTRQVKATVAEVGTFAERTRRSAAQIGQAVADPNHQAAALQAEAQQFVARVRAA